MSLFGIVMTLYMAVVAITISCLIKANMLKISHRGLNPNELERLRLSAWLNVGFAFLPTALFPVISTALLLLMVGLSRFSVDTAAMWSLGSTIIIAVTTFVCYGFRSVSDIFAHFEFSRKIADDFT